MKYWAPRRWLRPLWTSLRSSATSSSSPSSSSWRCLSFSSSTLWWVSLFAETGLTVQTVQKTGWCSSWIGTRLSLCNDKAGWSRQFSLEVSQVQFLPGCGRPCGHAGRPGVPDEAGRWLRFSSSEELGYDGSAGVFGAFCATFRAPPVVRS